MSTCKDSDVELWFGLIAGASILAFGIGLWLGVVCEGRSWRLEAIERGHASYNSTTGEWQWNDASVEEAP